MEGELLDWEVLHNSDADSNSILVNSPDLWILKEIEAATEGIIRSDYFSLDNQGMNAEECDVNEERSAESDNPSWMDPKPETRYGRNNSGDSGSNSVNYRLDDCELSDFDVKNEVGFAENDQVPVCFEGIGEMEGRSDKSFKPDDIRCGELDREKEIGLGLGLGIEEIQNQDKDLGKLWFDSSEDGLVSAKLEDVVKEGDIDFSDCTEKGAESTVGLEVGEGNTSGNEEGSPIINEMKFCVKSVHDGDKKRVVWWKVPLELLRCCIFKVSPVWSLSVAAAVMGFVMLGHRLYKMKRKSRRLQLEVTMDDQKVSQFMTRASRLNNAFSAVKRIPIRRPSLLTTGVNPWPVMSLR